MNDEEQVAKVTQEKTNEENMNDESSNTSARAEKPTGSSFSSVLISFLSIVAIIAVCALGYFGYAYVQQFSERLNALEQQEVNSQSAIQGSIADLSNTSSQLLSQQSLLQQQLDQQNSSIEKNLADISAQLSDTRRKIQAVGGTHQSDWMLAEADYLVRMASNRLLLEHDYPTALVLLVNADERIMLMDDPSLQPVREALSRDMATLRLAKRADIAGLAFRINSLIPQLKVLPALAFQLPEEVIKETATTAADIGWQQSLKNTLKELSVKWFEVRNHGRQVTPLMAPETEAILLTNMTLLLQTTQFATLRQHSELYHNSLLQLKDLINEYFDTADAVVIAFVNEIDLLNATSVQEDLPKALESRLIIAREIDRRLHQVMTPSALVKPMDKQQ